MWHVVCVANVGKQLAKVWVADAISSPLDSPYSAIGRNTSTLISCFIGGYLLADGGHGTARVVKVAVEIPGA
jgi:hypothetical protein